MAGKKTVKTSKEPKGVAEPEKRPAKLEESRAAVVKKLLKKLEKQLGGGEEVKASLGDYIRLVQLHKELDEEAPREIKVTWVDPAGDKAANKESGGEE